MSIGVPGKEITNGLVLIENNAQIVQMTKATKSDRTLILYVDHTNFLQQLRADVIIRDISAPSVVSHTKIYSYFPSFSVALAPIRQASSAASHCHLLPI